MVQLSYWYSLTSVLLQTHNTSILGPYLQCACDQSVSIQALLSEQRISAYLYFPICQCPTQYKLCFEFMQTWLLFVCIKCLGKYDCFNNWRVWTLILHIRVLAKSKLFRTTPDSIKILRSLCMCTRAVYVSVCYTHTLLRSLHAYTLTASTKCKYIPLNMFVYVLAR